MSRHTTEQEAREAAFAYGQSVVTIILSASKERPAEPYFLEEGDGGMIRSWERHIYTGPGREAISKKAATANR